MQTAPPNWKPWRHEPDAPHGIATRRTVSGAVSRSTSHWPTPKSSSPTCWRCRASISILTPIAPSVTRSFTPMRPHLCRRRQGEPVQYITGRQEFRSLNFEVNPQVLIPRSESELLVEHGARWAQQWAERNRPANLQCLDVGTGSGNLGISLLHELPECHVFAIDSSLAALKVARRNARQLGVMDRWHGLCGGSTGTAAI